MRFEGVNPVFVDFKLYHCTSDPKTSYPCMKKAIIFCFVVCACVTAVAQSGFVDYQRSFPRVAKAMNRKQDTLKKQFAAAGIEWPAKEIYIRSFKYDSQLEVWVRNSSDAAFKLFKTYRVCALAGTMGPKRMEGDYQVPEGFYYINEFKPNSAYNLSLGINYPNASDKVLSDEDNPGSGIFIHGSCITVGCIPIMDEQIEELYVLAANAKNSGQDFIPVHIFPIRFNNPKSVEYLTRITKDQQDIQVFETKLKEVYDYFEKEKKLPIISVNKKGEYVVL